MTGIKNKPAESPLRSAAQSGFAQMFRSLSNRNYQLYFSGQLVSMIGTWMQQLALSWLIYRLTNSALLLGLIAFVTQAPTLIITPFAGILADRFNRHKVLVVTQTLSMLQACVLAYLTLAGHIQIWQIIILGLFMGCINAVDLPARSAFVVDMVEKREDMPNAIALNSSLMNLTRMVGPALAGVVIAWIGEGMCFLVNAVSYIAVIAALVSMRIKPKPSSTIEPVSVLGHLKEGFSYAFRFEPIRILLLIMAVTSVAGMPYMMLMPMYVQETFHGGASTLGLLMAATSIGSLIGTMLLAARESILGLGKWICGSMVLFSSALIIFALTRNMIAALILLAIIGFGMMIQTAATSTLIQTIVDEDKRGRVMSLFAMCFMGIMPLGSLLAGFLASQFGFSWTIVIGAVVCLLVAIYSFKLLPRLREQARHIYVAKGIIQGPQSI